MKQYLYLLVALGGVALAGCAPSRPPASTAAMNAELARRPVRLHTADGAALQAIGVRIEADSVSWIDPDTGHVHAAHASEVLRVETFSRRRGTRRLGTWGMIAGGAIGLAVGIAAVDNTSLLVEAFPSDLMGRTYGALYAAGSYAGVVGGVGALVGLLAGDRETYDLSSLQAPAPLPGDAGRDR